MVCAGNDPALQSGSMIYPDPERSNLWQRMAQQLL